MLIVSSTKSHQYLAKSIKSNNNGTCTRNLHRTRALCISLEIYDSILIAEKNCGFKYFDLGFLWLLQNIGCYCGEIYGVLIMIIYGKQLCTP